MASSTSRPVSHERWRLASLWAGVLTGPLAFLALLELNYLLAHVACATRVTWLMHLAVVVALCLVAASGYAAWAASFGDTLEDRSAAPPLSDETRIQRSRWMSLVGITFSVWFAIAILAMEVPLLVLQECQ
jgi:hypothetical protein